MCPRDLGQTNKGTVHHHRPPGERGQASVGSIQRYRISIQTQETAIGGRSREYPGRMPTPSQRRVYVPATWPNLQAVENRLEKNGNMGRPHPLLLPRVELTSRTTGLRLLTG